MCMSHILSVADIHGSFLSLPRQACDQWSEYLLQPFTDIVSLEVMQEAQKALPSIHGLSPSHVCDAWRWALVAGMVLTVSSIQPVLVPNGISLTATMDIDTLTEIQVLQFVPLALVLGIPPFQYVQYTNPDTQLLVSTWCAPFPPV